MDIQISVNIHSCCGIYDEIKSTEIRYGPELTWNFTQLNSSYNKIKLNAIEEKTHTNTYVYLYIYIYMS